MTGTAERGGSSAQLLESGQMELLPYPVHQYLSQMNALAAANAFVRVIPYHSAKISAEAFGMGVRI